MGKKIPEDYMGTVSELPRIPPQGWAEDYRDDWINLVGRRLARQDGMSDLSGPQRRAIAAMAFQRAFRKNMVQCEACQGNGWYLTSNDESNTRCELCHGRGEVGKPTARYVGRDARTRPVIEYLEHKKWRRYAVGREGQPVDVAEPITEVKFTWKR